MGASPRVHFVTGFPGFIGKRLVRLLAAERQPRDRLLLLVQPKDLPAATAALSTSSRCTWASQGRSGRRSPGR